MSLFDAGFFIAAAILVIPFLLGTWYAKWYAGRSHPEMVWVRLVCWSNLLTWLLPPIGTLTAGATFRFNREPRSTGSTGRQVKYDVLATIGLVLAIGNAFTAALRGIGPI